LVSAAASILAEIVAPIVSLMLEMCMHLLMASARPCYYVLSPRFRSEVNARYASKHPILKWLNLLWGSCLLLLSLGVVVGLVWFFSSTHPETESPPGIRHKAVEKAEQVMTGIFKKHQDGK
jgi:hypothetical protein